MQSRPNVLFLLSDEHSFRFFDGDARDSTRPELYEECVTPVFSGLARNGTLFTDAYCQMPLCTPSRISLLTGQEPRHCGAWSNGSVLRPELPTIASALGESGYRTALIGKMHLGGRAQYAGFHDRPYGDLTGKTGHQWEPIESDDRTSMRVRTTQAGITGIPESLLQEQVTAQETVAWIREQESSADAPWFALASFSRPHFPLTAPKRWIEHYRRSGVSSPMIPAAGDAFDHPMSRGMRKGFRVDEIDDQELMNARLSYFACVSYLDEIIGDLLTRLRASGSLENTVIIYTSDHGELAGEHGVWWKNGWYEGCTRVPLIISTPEQRKDAAPAALCRTPVGLVDLLPTICDISGADTPAQSDGRSLAAAVDGQPIADEPISCDALTPRWGAGTEFRSVRYRSAKYVRFRDAAPLGFDLVRDPGEQINLLSATGPLPHDLRVARDFAEQNIDFDEAEKERTERDGDLVERYRLRIDSGSGNFYAFASGRLVNADDAMLFDTRVHAATAEEVFVRKPL